MTHDRPASKPSDPPPSSDQPQERISFDGLHRTLARVHFPKTLAELAELLRTLGSPEGGGPWPEKGGVPRRLTICAGNQSLDAQSLGDHVVIQLGGEELSRIGEPRCDEKGWHVTLGAAARWGDVVKALADHGIVPYSVVTTAHATVGGTVSADCLSRSSPLTGREGRHVRSFKLITVDGRTLTCHRDDPDPDQRLLYRAVIGGFGYLGVLTELTLDVRPPLPGWTPGRKIRVATRCDKNFIGAALGEPWSNFLPALREREAAAALTDDDPSLISRIFGPDHPPVPSSATPWDAVSSGAWYALGGFEALLFRSRYVLDREIRPLPIYEHASKLNDLIALGSVTPALAELGETILYALHGSGVYVDDLHDFTFFMENQIVPAMVAAHASGWRLNTIQQTFVLPAKVTPDDPAGLGPTREFLDRIRPVLFSNPSLPALLEPMRPTLIDVLYLPSDDFLLSATRGLDGYAVTLTFTQRDRDGWDELQERLRALSRVCHDLGGRIHMIKDVVADQEVLAAMYGDAFAEFLAVKRRYDPHGVLENAFFDRVFGEEAASSLRGGAAR